MRANHLSYFPTLDAIRAIAVILVLIQHWFPEDYWWIRHTGEVGVAMFFVLSGFLITRILLYEKDNIADNKTTFWEAIKRFYIRRSLRIFPVYYLLVAAMFLLDSVVSIGIQGSPWYFITYTTNFYIFSYQRWIGPLSATWSLCVEEQFYLIWPFVILIVSNKWIKASLFVTMIISYLFLVWLNTYYTKYPLNTILVVPCMGSFALGGLLAYRLKTDGHLTIKFKATIYTLGIVALCLFILLCYWPQHPFKNWRLGWFYCSLPCLAFIIYSMDERKNFVHKLFSNKILINIGKMSYGIYLYHYPVSSIWPFLRNKLHSTHIYPTLLHESWVADLLVNLTATLIISHFSFKYFEKPINSLKSKFE